MSQHAGILDQAIVVLFCFFPPSHSLGHLVRGGAVQTASVLATSVVDHVSDWYVFAFGLTSGDLALERQYTVLTLLPQYVII